MALNKGNKILRELMVARNKGTTSQENPKSQVPTTLPPLLPTIPADLGQKPIPDLKKKRPVEVPEEGEVGPQKETKNRKWPKMLMIRALNLWKAAKKKIRLMCALHNAHGPFGWR